jgi:hypothetical protein
VGSRCVVLCARTPAGRVESHIFTSSFYICVLVSRWSNFTSTEKKENAINIKNHNDSMWRFLIVSMLVGLSDLNTSDRFPVMSQLIK